MSIDIHVYCDRPVDEVAPLVKSVIEAHPDDYDPEEFHAPFPVRSPEPVDARILRTIERHEFRARSFLVIILNDKSRAGPDLHLAVGRFVQALDAFRTLVLFDNESVFPTTRPGPLVRPSIDDARRLLDGVAETDLHGARTSRIRTWLAGFVAERSNADALAALMPRTSSTAKALIADALAGTGRPEFVPALLPLLDRGGLWHRTAVRRAIWRLAVSEQKPRFRELAARGRRAGALSAAWGPTKWTLTSLVCALDRGQKWWGYHEHWYRGRAYYVDRRAAYFRAFAVR